MFSPDELIRKLLEVNQLQALALLETARHTNSVPTPSPVSVRPPRPHQPQEKDFRVWSKFRAAMIKFEHDVRVDLQLGPDAEVTREQIYRLGGPNPRTLRRIMLDTYGLLSDQWPPSTWPADPPKKS
jgi:hypothetical protein